MLEFHQLVQEILGGGRGGGGDIIKVPVLQR